MTPCWQWSFACYRGTCRKHLKVPQRTQASDIIWYIVTFYPRTAGVVLPLMPQCPPNAWLSLVHRSCISVEAAGATSGTAIERGTWRRIDWVAWDAVAHLSLLGPCRLPWLRHTHIGIHGGGVYCTPKHSVSFLPARRTIYLSFKWSVGKAKNRPW